MQFLRQTMRQALLQRGYVVKTVPPALSRQPSAQLQLSFDHILSHFLIHCSTVPFFLQIGAFDGISGDPLYPYVKRGLLKGCLVEPQADAFERLKVNYAGVEGITLKRAAVSHESGEKLLYRVKPGTVGPEWLFQIASFSREVLLKHAVDVPGLEQSIVTEAVPVITADELMHDLPVAPNIIVIDTEGYDYEIIKLLNVAIRKPNIILYEHKHLSLVDQNACIDMLISAGYQLTLAGPDTVAYLSQ